jgi:hypothetical protein
LSIDNEEIRRETLRENERRIVRVRRICDAVEREGLDPAIGCREIEQVVTGEGDRVVKVGGPHRPDIQT